MTRTERETRARGRARAKFGFYRHLAVFLAVNLLLFFINLAVSPGTPWFIWPLMGWGVAILLHGASVYFFGSNDEIIDRMTEAELQRDASPRE